MQAAVALLLALLLGGCASAPAGSYYPPPTDPATPRVAQALRRAAVAARDDPGRYGFAFVRSPTVAVVSDEEANFYVTEGLARMPQPVIDALVAQAVAHEVLGHIGRRRALSLTVTAGFTALGFLVPGLNFADLIANPIAVRAFSRQQVLDADRKAVALLARMGYPAPRATLAAALTTAAEEAPRPKEGSSGLLATLPPLAARLEALGPLEPAARSVTSHPR